MLAIENYFETKTCRGLGRDPLGTRVPENLFLSISSNVVPHLSEREAAIVTRSISGSLIASAISRWYGHKRTRPGSGLKPCGSSMFASIQMARPA